MEVQCIEALIFCKKYEHTQHFVFLLLPTPRMLKSQCLHSLIIIFQVELAILGSSQTNPFQCSRLASFRQLGVDTICSCGQANLHDLLESDEKRTCCNKSMQKVLKATTRVL